MSNVPDAQRRAWLDVQVSYEVMAKLITGSQTVTGGRVPTLKDLRVAAQALKTDAAWLMKIIADLEAATALGIT